jgi:hypothetical protein
MLKQKISTREFILQEGQGRGFRTKEVDKVYRLVFKLLEYI